MKATKKPVTIEAVKWNGENSEEIIAFFRQLREIEIYRFIAIKHEEKTRHVVQFGEFSL
jgi:hypothetical protein